MGRSWQHEVASSTLLAGNVKPFPKPVVKLPVDTPGCSWKVNVNELAVAAINMPRSRAVSAGSPYARPLVNRPSWAVEVPVLNLDTTPTSSGTASQPGQPFSSRNLGHNRPVSGSALAARPVVAPRPTLFFSAGLKSCPCNGVQ